MFNSDIIKKICLNLDTDPTQALNIIKNDYPFRKIEYQKRNLTEYDKLSIYIRDGFIDRYFGTKLIFAPVLRIISHLFPNEFPLHSNWKMDSCHIAYWELVPTLDHIMPISRGGMNSYENVVSTSMLHNSVKSNFTLQEVGWTLKPCGDFNSWDGMLHWYIEYVRNHPEFLNQSYFKSYFDLALRVLRA